MNSLRARMILIITAANLMIGAITAVSYHRLTQRGLENELIVFTRSELEQLPELLGPIMWSFQTEIVELVCRERMHSGRIAYLRVLDESDQVIFLSEAPVDPSMTIHHRGIFYGDRRIGTLDLAVNATGLAEHRKADFNITALTLFTVVLATIILLILLVESLLLKPYRQIRQILDDLKDGKYETSKPAKVFSETRPIFDKLDALSDALGERRRENRAYAGNLEKSNEILTEELYRRQVAESRLKHTEERYKLALEFTNDGIFDWNIISNEIYYSPEWKRLLGYEDDELPNDFSVWERLTEPEDVKRSWEMQQELITGKREKFELIFKMKHKDGSWRDILSRARARFDEEGRVVRIVGTHMDVTALVRSEAEIFESRERLRELTRRLEQIRETERTGIARDLHDDLGQALTAVVMELDWLKNSNPDFPDSVIYRLNSIKDLIHGSIDGIRRTCSRLRPGILDNLGLVPALEWYLEDLARRRELSTELNGDNLDLPDELATQLFRIFQELVTNVLRHADASSVRVSIEETDGEVILTVVDDGVGFSVEEPTEATSLGLLGIRERVLALRGHLDIASTPGEGTTVVVRVPQD